MNEAEAYDRLLDAIAYKIESDGFDYAFVHYSDWRELQEYDMHLFKLIAAYRAAHFELASYLNAIGVHDDGF